MQAQFHARFHLSAVDTETGVITGVRVITEGPAKGHHDWASGKPMRVDSTTLEQIMACAQSYKGGLKVKMDHQGGAGDIVGSLRNFRIIEDHLAADLHLLKSSPSRAYILEIAESIPDTFGLSVAFSGPVEEGDDVAFARCSEIYSADLVSEPAANPTGLFDSTTKAESQSQTTTHHKMEDEPKEDPIAKLSGMIEELSNRLSALENPVVEEPEAEMAEGEIPGEEKKEEMSAQLSADEVAEKAAQAALSAYVKQFGVPAPAKASHEADRQDPNPAPKKFEDIVREHPEYASNRAKAIRLCIAEHGAAHAEYRQRVNNGDVILF